MGKKRTPKRDKKSAMANALTHGFKHTGLEIDRNKENLPPASDEQLFQKAMRGIVPLTKNRQPSGKIPSQAPLPAAKNISPPNSLGQIESPVRVAAKSTVVAEEEPWVLDKELICGRRQSVSNKILSQLRTGYFRHEAQLDLHGYRASIAEQQLRRFVLKSREESKRCLLVVTGKGTHSHRGIAVLKNELTGWLTSPPTAQHLLAFAPALPQHGGSGATYLLLKKPPK